MVSKVKWPEMSYFLEFKGWAMLSHWLHAPKKHRSHVFSKLSNSICVKLNRGKNSDRQILTVPLVLQVNTVQLAYRSRGLCRGVRWKATMHTWPADKSLEMDCRHGISDFHGMAGIYLGYLDSFIIRIPEKSFSFPSNPLLIGPLCPSQGLLFFPHVAGQPTTQTEQLK